MAIKGQTWRAFGQPVRRREDPKLITGSATYVDDLTLPGMTYMVVVRSPYAHARIRGVRSEAARSVPGVVAVLTAADIQGATTGPLPYEFDLNLLLDAQDPARQVLAADKVRHVGDPVMVVVAETRYAAHDAAALVEVDYEPLPAVVDPEAALADGAPLLFEEFGTNLAHRMVRDSGNVDEAFRAADRIVALRVVNQRQLPSPLETHGSVAEWRAGRPGDSGELTLWASTQMPHALRTRLAGLLDVRENKFRVIAPDVGGGFGNKIDITSGVTLTAIMAMRLGRPVKWIEERGENARSAAHGRGQTDEIEAAVMHDGRVTGLKVRAIYDLGAYYQYTTPLMGLVTGTMMPGPYDIPNIHFELVGVFTNKVPVGAYRGAGRPEATYLLECLMDEVAHALGHDPAEIRRRNFVSKETFPHTTALGLMLDSGDYEAALDRALEGAGYRQLKDEQQAARARGELMGVGLAAYVEICGFGPWESATVRVEASGLVTAYTGTSPHGQGTATTMAQIVADQLGADLDDIRVLHGDTASTPTGVGTFGSRSAAVGGVAMSLASGQVAEKAVRIAAHLLEASTEDIDITPDGYAIRGASQKCVSLAQIAGAAYGGNVPHGDEPGLEATRFFQPEGVTCPFGVHIAVVAVDKDTGRVTLRRHIAVDDCGPVINPLIAEGQRHGGIAQGVSQALFEEVIYDEQGQLVTASLSDYAVPSASAFPMFELDRTETPSPLNPLGVKGIGEAPTIGSTPAVRNAILDALRPLGITHLDMAFTPHKVWRAMQATAHRRGTGSSASEGRQLQSLGPSQANDTSR